MVSLTAFRLAEAAAPVPPPLAMERRSPSAGGRRPDPEPESPPLSPAVAPRDPAPAARAPPTPGTPRPRHAPSRTAPTRDGVDLNLEPRSLARNLERGVSVRIHPSASTPLAGSRTAVRHDWPAACPRPVPWLAGDNAEKVKESAPGGLCRRRWTFYVLCGWRCVLRGPGLDCCLLLESFGFLASGVPARFFGVKDSRDRAAWKPNGHWK